MFETVECIEALHVLAVERKVKFCFLKLISISAISLSSYPRLYLYSDLSMLYGQIK